MKSLHKKSLMCTMAAALCALLIDMAIGALTSSSGGMGAATHVGAAPQARRNGTAEQLQHLARSQEPDNLARGITVTGGEVFGRFAGAGEVDTVDHAKSAAVLHAKLGGLRRTDKHSGQARRQDLP